MNGIIGGESSAMFSMVGITNCNKTPDNEIGLNRLSVLIVRIFFLK